MAEKVPYDHWIIIGRHGLGLEYDIHLVYNWGGLGPEMKLIRLGSFFETEDVLTLWRNASVRSNGGRQANMTPEVAELIGRIVSKAEEDTVKFRQIMAEARQLMERAEP
jgi:hypothetical protein